MPEPADVRLRNILLGFGEETSSLRAVQDFLGTNPTANEMAQWLRERVDTTDEDVEAFLKVAHHYGALGGPNDGT